MNWSNEERNNQKWLEQWSGVILRLLECQKRVKELESRQRNWVTEELIFRENGL